MPPTSIQHDPELPAAERSKIAGIANTLNLASSTYRLISTLMSCLSFRIEPAMDSVRDSQGASAGGKGRGSKYRHLYNNRWGERDIKGSCKKKHVKVGQGTE